MQSGTFALRGATLINGTGADPVRGVTVLVENGTITGVGTAVSVPADVPVEDADGLTLLPGLIDAHVHVMFQGFNLMRQLSTPPTLAILKCIPNLHATLNAGFTTVRDAAGAPLGVKMAIEQGIIPGPRMRISVTALSQTGGHADRHTLACIHMAVQMPDIPPSVVDGIEPMRLRVREILRAGADWIKLCTTGGVLSQTDKPASNSFTVEEIATAVYEGQAHGDVEVMAHAQGTQGIKNAILGGVKSIEHGIWLDEETIGLMKARDVYLVPTLVAPVQVLRQGEADPTSMPPWGVEKARQVIVDHQASFRAAHEAGVNIAMGTDSGVGPHGQNAEEMALMVNLGMSPMEAIVATTSRAAKLLKMEKQVGTVETGKLADLVLVDGDPLADITVLQNTDNIVTVVKGGVAYKDARRPVPAAV
jgi:imidazolonepropionase-like amidohydrolase